MSKRSTKVSKKVSTDPHILYQLSVQSPEFELDFIDTTYKKLRGKFPLALREDFCGTALSSCEWVKRRPKNTAVAADIDQSVLDWCLANNYSGLSKTQAKRINIQHGDVLTLAAKNIDVCQAFNFSYWVFQERKTMLKYFRNVKKSLTEKGVFFLDAFGGYEAHKTQKETRKVDGFSYVWEQEAYNSVTGEMHCKIHFKLPGGKQIKNAFSYTWRLWGARELREILIDAGFKKTTLYLQEFDDETDEPLDSFAATDHAEDYACWIGYIVAEK